MPKTPKEKPKTGNTETDTLEKDSWSEDQKKREYYYDDACGYAVYRPDEEEKEEAD